MLDGAPITYWIGFHAVVIFLIVVDLVVLGRSQPASQNRHNFFFVLFLFALAAAFGVWIGYTQGHQTALEFASGYLIELSLSIDNLFVFLLLFRSFGLTTDVQRKALLLGILGAIVMRGVFIFAGIALLQRFAWIEYLFGAFLIIAAVRLLRGKKAETTPGPARYITRWKKHFGDSPRAVFLLAVLTIEVVDLVFALDSVPAVLAISHHPFIVYTSNIFAILGLRSLYFLLAGLLERLRYLHLGLAAILGFVGAKMVLGKWVHVSVGISLGVIVLVVLLATVASLMATRGTQPAHSWWLRYDGFSVRKILVSTKFGPYTVSVGSGILDSLAKQVAALATSPRSLVFVLTAPEIWGLWGERLCASLSPREPIVLFLPAGERHKRMAQVERLATEMTRAGADRSSLLIAFGGGVTGDVGGFLSAIYMRGIEYIQVPTTLLSQVDSSVGGKTGVNLQTGKNLVGCFYPPQAVLADIALLQTLPPRELRAGIYESIKAGMIRDASLFRYIESHREQLDRGEPAPLEKMVAASIRIKAEVVSLDEREHGVRMHLNFGHTLGHAIEAATGYRALLHGEAIAWGMIAALHISLGRQMLTVKAVERMESLIRSFNPPPLPAISAKRLLQAAAGDKKNRAGVRRFVLLEALGKAVVAEDVTDAEVVAGIEAMRRVARS